MRRILPALILALSFCSQNYMTLAKINGESISVGDFKTRLGEVQFDSKFVAEDESLGLKKSILNEMIEEKIVQQEAKKLNIKVSDDEVAKAYSIENLDEILAAQKITKEYWNQRTRQKVLAEKLFDEITKTTTHPTDVEIKDVFDKNQALFHQNEQVHLLQIILKTKEEAEQTQKLLAQGKDFAEMAKNLAMNSDATSGGDLGFVSRGILPEAIEKKVFGIKAGSLSPTLESESQFYIYKVLEKKEDKQLTFEESRQRIETMLFQKAKETLYSQWLQDKMIHAKIKRNYELLQENIHA